MVFWPFFTVADQSVGQGQKTSESNCILAILLDRSEPVGGGSGRRRHSNFNGINKEDNKDEEDKEKNKVKEDNKDKEDCKQRRRGKKGRQGR